MAKSDVVTTKLTGGETAQQAFEKLSKAYDHATVVQMLERGEYDVLYRKTRTEVTSERQKAQRARIKQLEELAAKHGWLETEKGKLK